MIAGSVRHVWKGWELEAWGRTEEDQLGRDLVGVGAS